MRRALRAACSAPKPFLLPRTSDGVSVNPGTQRASPQRTTLRNRVLLHRDAPADVRLSPRVYLSSAAGPIWSSGFGAVICGRSRQAPGGNAGEKARSGAAEDPHRLRSKMGFFPSSAARSDILCGVSDYLPDELPPNYEFGGYVICACIGRGGMAHVYRAQQAALQREVALKVVDRWVLDTPHGSERFLREARAAASIKHPNVVDILDVGVWRERPYIVMELLKGCDLEAHLERRGALPDAEVAALALPIIAGVMAVHEAGVVHRDLKPSNIFLSDEPEGEVIPKVLDFGVSKVSNGLNEPLHRATNTREILGTPTYMAPEALNGVRELGVHADQYSIGAVLYECAIGRPPFEGETLLELLKAIALGAVDPPRSLRPEISPALDAALLRALSADPNARFESLRDLGRALWPLADERTQTIWERSFGNGKLARRSNEITGPVLLAPPERLRSGPARLLASRGGRSALALGAVAALVGLLFIGEEETVERELPKQAPAAFVPLPPVGERAEEAETVEQIAADEQERGAKTPPRAARVEKETRTPQRRVAAKQRARTTPQRRATPTRRSVTRALQPVASPPPVEPELQAAPARAEAAVLDPDLGDFFAAPRERSAASAVRRDSELGSLFPSSEMELGVNDAPIPD